MVNVRKKRTLRLLKQVHKLHKLYDDIKGGVKVIKARDKWGKRKNWAERAQAQIKRTIKSKLCLTENFSSVDKNVDAPRKRGRTNNFYYKSQRSLLLFDCHEVRSIKIYRETLHFLVTVLHWDETESCFIMFNISVSILQLWVHKHYNPTPQRNTYIAVE